MSQPDFFSPIKYEPPPPPSRPKLPVVLFVVLAAVLLLGGGGVFAVLKFKPAPKATAQGIPPASVQTGTKVKWRELDTYDWVAGMDHPRPSIVVADFNSDHQQDILQVDPKGVTALISPQGKKSPVEGAEWNMLCRFTPWDYNADGQSELVPDAFVFAYVQTPKGYTSVRIKGG